jgi:hypothetical protein
MTAPTWPTITAASASLRTVGGAYVHLADVLVHDPRILNPNRRKADTMATPARSVSPAPRSAWLPGGGRDEVKEHRCSTCWTPFGKSATKCPNEPKNGEGKR